MGDAPDPLGRRALFWAPAERDDDGPRGPIRPTERQTRGKYALFTDAGRPHAAKAPSARRRSPASPANGVGAPRPAGAGGVAQGPGGALSHRRGALSSIAIECSSCGDRSEVDVLEYLILHLPLWLWRPGRGYTRFMTCPMCRRRTWVSASWDPRAH